MAARNKFGWHSGVLKCKDAKILQDLYVQDDIVFSDVSAGVLGITGGLDMTGTVSAIGIDLTGSTCTTAQIAVGTATGTPQTMAEAEDFALAIFTTCADTDGANTAKPLYVNAAYTGAGQVGRAAEFVLRPTAGTLMGGWCNAVKAYIDFSTTSGTGGSTGLASALCAEMRLPKGACSGAFYVLELEYVDQSSTSFSTPGTGSQAGFISINCAGTITDLDDNGVFMSLNGLTAGANDLLSANNQTLKVDINQGTTKYLLLSGITDALSLDSCATAITLGDNVTTTGIQIGNVPTGILLDGSFTTGIKMEGSVSYNPIVIGTKSSTTQVGLTMTGVLDNTSGVMIFADDGDAALTASWITSPIWTRYILFHDQASVTPTGAYLQLKLKKAGLAITTSDVSATKVYLELDSTVTIGSGSLSIINAGMTMNGAITDTSQKLSGIDININDGTDALDTAKASTGLRIRKTSGSTAGWPIGIGIEDTGATTGIKIGDCTTGLDMDGTMTTCLDFTSATLAPDDSRTNSAIAIGDRAGAHTVTMSGATLHLDPIQINLLVAGSDPTSGSTINGIYQLITGSAGTDMSGLRLKCSDWNIVVAQDIKDVYCMQGEVDFITNSLAVGGEAAVLGLVMNCTSTVTGGVSGIVLSMTGGGMPVQSYGLFMSVGATATLTNGIYMETQGGTTMTYGLNIANGATGTFTNVMRCAGTIAYFLHLDDAGNSGFVTTGGTDCTSSGGTSPGYTIKCVMPDGGDGYIRVWDSA